MEEWMIMNEVDIWVLVKGLTGKTLQTYIEGEKNTIIKVEDTGSPKDEVIIMERNTYPIREDIVAAYQLFEKNKQLCRSEDLEWLAGPDKKTSSIVFRIVGEIAGNKAMLIKKRPETLILKI